MIDKGLMGVIETGIFSVAVTEWKVFDEANKTWPEWKAHFIKIYSIYNKTKTLTVGMYHGAKNAT